MHLDDGVAFGVEGHGADGRPVARGARPTSGVERASARVQRMPRSQDRLIFTVMALSRADVADAAVTMVVVVPTHEAGGPGPGLIAIAEALGGGLRTGLGRS